MSLRRRVEERMMKLENKKGVLVYSTLLAIGAPDDRAEEARLICEAMIETMEPAEIEECMDLIETLMLDTEVHEWATAKWSRQTPAMPNILVTLFGLASGPQGPQIDEGL